MPDFILLLLAAWATVGALLGALDEALVLRWYARRHRLHCRFEWESVGLGALFGPLAIISVVATLRKWRWA